MGGKKQNRTTFEEYQQHSPRVHAAWPVTVGVGDDDEEEVYELPLTVGDLSRLLNQLTLNPSFWLPSMKREYTR